MKELINIGLTFGLLVADAIVGTRLSMIAFSSLLKKTGTELLSIEALKLFIIEKPSRGENLTTVMSSLLKSKAFTSKEEL